MSDGDDKNKPRNGSAAERAWEIRRTRMRRIARRFAVVVGAPTLLAIVYYTMWAAEEYVSETVINISAPADSSDALGQGNFVANRATDQTLVRQTIYSQSTLDALSEASNWREHYREHGDMFSRLRGDGSEETLAYFRKKVHVSAPAGSPLKLQVRAFSGEAAAEFSQKILEIAEERVNAITARPIDDQLSVARAQLEAARKELASTAAPPDLVTAPSPERTAALEKVAAAEKVVSKLVMVRAGQRRYLTVVSGPTRPDEARYPKRIWGIATVFVVAFAVMGIFSLLFGAVREHAKV